MRNLLYLFLFVLISTNAQEINYTKKLRFTSETGEKLSVSEVRKLFKDEMLLEKFNSEVSTRTVGNVLLISGPILILTDLFVALYGPHTTYPGIISYIGLIVPIIGMLAKSGYQKRIKDIIDSHNKSQKNTSSIETDLLLNGNGVGLSITF
jgi:hypothetical protein